MVIGVVKNILVVQSGSNPMRVLKSSTFCTLHNLHGFAAILPSESMSLSVIRAARLKNLHAKALNYNFLYELWMPLAYLF